MRSYLSGFVLAFFAYGGGMLARRPTLERLLALAVRTLLALFLLGYVVGFVNTRAIRRKIEILLQASGFLFFLYMRELTRYHGRRLSQCVAKLRTLPPDIFGDDSPFPADATVRGVLVELLRVYLAPFSVFTTYSLLVSPFVESVWRAQDNYILPHWFACSDSGSDSDSGSGPVRRNGTRTLSFLCYEAAAYRPFLAFNLLQFVVIVALFQFYFLPVAFYVTAVKTLEMIARRLIDMVALISLQMEMDDGRSSVEKSCASYSTMSSKLAASTGLRTHDRRKELRDHFVKLIRGHQYLRRFANEMRPYLTSVSSACFFEFFLAVLLSIFMISSGIESSYNSTVKVRVAGLVGICMGGLYFFCRGAETVIVINESIANAIYETPWYFQPDGINKMVLHFLVELARPIVKITCLAVYGLSWSFSAQLLKFIYSVLNLMLALF